MGITPVNHRQALVDNSEAMRHIWAMSDKRHKALWAACKKLPLDYTPYGQLKRWEDPKKVPYYPDCSCGCRFFVPLDDNGKADSDWGICSNPKSHRCGLLTFEHQGCLEFKSEKE